jgi:hypothetical protein
MGDSCCDLDVVDIVAHYRRRVLGRHHKFWDSCWAQLSSLPQGKAMRLPLGILRSQAPAVLHEGQFTCNSWQEIKAKLDLRRKNDSGVRKGPSPIRHQWSHDSVADSEWVDVWMERP